MHADISLQLAQLAASVLTGFALGLCYDVLRALRRVLKTNVLFDVLFGAVLLPTLFILGMDIGQGGVHIFMFFAVAGGAAAYMALLSPAILPFFVRAAAAAGKIAAPIGKAAKKFSAAVKKCFSKTLNWYTIKKQSTNRRKGKRYEKIDDDRRTGIDDACRICYSEYGEHKAGPRGRNGSDAVAARGDKTGPGRERLP